MNHQEIILQLIAVGGSILGCIIGAIISYFGVNKTLKQERRIQQQNRIIEAKRTRPNLTIKSIINSDEMECSFVPNVKIQILKIARVNMAEAVPQFEFVGNNIDEGSLSYFDFELENEGHSEICELSFTTSMSKYYNIIDFESRKYYIDEKMPSIDVLMTDLFVKPGDRLVIRVYFSRELDGDSYIPNINVWALDSTDYVWLQTLDVKKGKVSNSRFDRYDFYKSEHDLDGYVSYFKESYKMYLK